jgi:hypothetical protein
MTSDLGDSASIDILKSFENIDIVVHCVATALGNNTNLSNVLILTKYLVQILIRDKITQNIGKGR